MTTEPRDPCPVCGASVHIDALSEGDGPGRVAVLCGPASHTRQSPCLYYNLLVHHRRLCAEVALARLVLKIDDDPNTSFAIGGGMRAFERVDQFADAIARVREASK